MKRDIIKIEENTIRVTGCDVWMSEPELVELFGTPPIIIRYKVGYLN